MKTNALYLFASTCIILLASCKKDPAPITTTITGKVVTFGEDSLYHDGPIEIGLYTSSSQWPNDHIETKTLYPPYDYRFVTEVNDPISDNFIVQLETDVPGHDRYYMHNYDWVNKGEDGEIMVELMPETTRQVRIINASQNSELIVNLYFCGKNYTYNPSYDGMERTITDQNFYHGWCSVDYQVHYTFTGTTITQVNDSIHTVPLDTVTYEIML